MSARDQVGGPHTVTFGAHLWKAWMFERATREW
jgi:hypothetical protein